MSVTIQIAGNTAVLADGQWRSANGSLRELLNAHLEASQLEVPGHLPPGDRELKRAYLAVAELGGEVVDVRRSDRSERDVPDRDPVVYGSA